MIWQKSIEVRNTVLKDRHSTLPICGIARYQKLLNSFEPLANVLYGRIVVFPRYEVVPLKIIARTIVYEPFNKVTRLPYRLSWTTAAMRIKVCSENFHRDYGNIQLGRLNKSICPLFTPAALTQSPEIRRTWLPV